MKTAFLFSGQGAQFVGMASDVYKNDIAKKTYGNAQKITGISILEISNNGPEEVLKESYNTQLAIVSLQVAILNIIKNAGISSQATAGLSLGEYSALYNAGSFTQKELFQLVKSRGYIMQDFANKNPGAKMIVVLGLKAEQTKKYVEQLAKKGKIIAVANYNLPKQQVIAGKANALNDFKEIATDAKRLIEIKVAVPSHTPFMQPIVESFKKEINKVEFKKMNQDFYGNITGEKTSSENVKEGLVNQLTNPTHIEKIIRNMLKDGIDTFVEIGPKKVLGSFVQKIAKEQAKEVKILLAKNIETTENVVSQLKGK